MKKVFTILSPTLLKGILLLFCLFSLFSHSVFSLDETTTNSTDAKPISTKNSEKSKSDITTSDIEDVDNCSGQTCLSTTKKDTDKKSITKDEKPSKSTKITADKSETKTVESDCDSISTSQNESTTSQEKEKTIENESISKESLPKQKDISTEHSIEAYTETPPMKQDASDTDINFEPTSTSKETIQTITKPLTKNKSEIPLEDIPIIEKTILITEILLDTSASNSKHHEEYIELYNTTDKNIILNGYSLKRNITRTTDKNKCDKIKKDKNLISSRAFTGVIEAHKYLIITHKDNPKPAWTNSITFSSQSATITNDSTIILYDDNDNIIDKVGFGNTCLYEETSTQSPNKNESIERNKKDGKYIDTDNNKADFHINKCPFPGDYLPTNLSSTVRINEIYPNPCKKDTPHCTETEEFIELYNPDKVSLDGWKLTDSSTISGTLENKNPDTTLLYIKLTKDHFRFTLNNSGDNISLIAPNCSITSQIKYNDSQKGKSINYAEYWYNAEPTPGTKNAIDPRTIKYPKLLLNEILPNPSGVEKTDEFIEIYNPNNIKINLKNWMLKDSSKTGTYTFPTKQYIEPKSFFTIYRKNFSFALNNSNETVSLTAPNEKIVSSISYKSSREDISYNYNTDSKSWRWSKYLTPSKKNVFNNLPTITKFDIDKNSYKNVYANFKTKATDKDSEKLKVRWDFGDGRKSYLWKTRHRYTKTGTYHGNLRIQDKSEEIIKKFTVTVKKYPKHKIEITKIVPNPSGKDSGVEYIIIKNESKEKINLQNWSIATGVKEKTLVNHPIYDKLILKPGKTKKITKKYTAISLPNKTGVIEIRRPNGSVADKQKYGHKDISIQDNSSFEKIDGIWTWTIPVNLEKQHQTQQIISQAIKNEKMFSQQILENKVAINAVYNSSNNTSRDIVQTNSNLFVTLLQNINSLLHKTILIAQSFSETLKLNQVLAYSYTPTQIDLPTQPCEKPYLFTTPTSQKFDLCK
ncbi:MAG: lamin tail domain-containing protein [Candidatus Moraniibacteriota bacterium]|jgi:Lamin Tail Domain/PKD domain